MKNPLQSLLIGCALGLCGLCAWQWHGQVLQRQELTKLAQSNYDQAQSIRGYTNSISAMERQIATLDASLTELRDLVKSNASTIAALRLSNTSFSNAAARYKAGAEDNAKQANEIIHQQNETIKSLVAERDRFVKQLNTSIQERNEIVTQYNALVKRVQEQPPSPTPAKK
jgi:predicted  nucleic acid-binding Zn-ribbon protein